MHASPSSPEFVRADSNADGEIDISDAILTMEFLFLPGRRSLKCQRSADADSNDELDLMDSIFTLRYVFLGTAEPSDPFPRCGRTRTESEISCDAFGPCSATK